MNKLKINIKDIKENQIIDQKKVLRVIRLFFRDTDNRDHVALAIDQIIKNNLNYDTYLTDEEHDVVLTDLWRRFDEYWKKGMNSGLLESQPATEPTKTLTSASKQQPKSAIAKKNNKKP